MGTLHEWLAGWSSQVWPFALTHLWQSTLFVALLLPVLLLLNRAPARLRYGLSLVASMKFLLPAALLFSWLAGSGLARLLSAPAGFAIDLGPWLDRLVSPLAHAAGTTLHSEIYCLLSLVWLLGASSIAALWFWRQRSLVQLLAEAKRVTHGREAEILAAVRARLGIRRQIELALLAGDAEPGVFRVRRPVLLLPEEMPASLSAAELEAIFLHELVHVKRHDNLVASLHRGLCCLFWFHPLVWMLDRRLLAEREEACDEGVLALGGRAEVYARGLLKTVQFGLGWRLASVSSAGASNLKRRIERILAGPSPRPSLANHLGLAVAVMLFAAFSLAVGSHVQQPDQPLATLGVVPAEVAFLKLDLAAGPLLHAPQEAVIRSTSPLPVSEVQTARCLKEKHPATTSPCRNPEDEERVAWMPDGGPRPRRQPMPLPTTEVPSLDAVRTAPVPTWLP